jgi:hypothetical protein
MRTPVLTAAVVIAASAAALRSAPARAWGDTGHVIIALIAADRLTPRAKAAVVAILANDPAGKSLSAVSGWADRVRRTTMPETYNWHFVDIPVDRQLETYDAARDCQPDPAKGDCIIAALAREVPKLSGRTRSPTERADALKFVTHLVGDLHQPLHCAERNGDHGGNDVTVTFFGATDEPPPSRNRWNLHAVWDNGLIDHSRRDPAAFARELGRWIAAQDARAIEGGSMTDWANETHAVAVAHAYKTARGTAAFPAVGGRIGKTYYEANIRVVDEQLAKAGVRLAKVLNDALR